MKKIYLLGVLHLLFFGAAPGQSWIVKLNPDAYKSVQGRAYQNPNLGIAMSVSGGGHRAANLGAAVMIALENYSWNHNENDVNINLLKEVDYFSAVSGGTWICGAYISRLIRHGEASSFSLRQAYEDELAFLLRRNYQKLLIHNLFNPRLMFSSLNRGDILERAIDKKLLQGTKESSIVLGDFLIRKEDPEEVKFPYFVANAANFENYALVPVTPDVFEAYDLATYVHYTRKKTLPYKKNGFGKYDADFIPLSAGVSASSSFPVAIPSSIFERRTTGSTEIYLKKFRYLRLTDGGLNDQIGYKSALSMLEAENKSDKKLLLLVDAQNKGVFSPYASQKKRPRVFRELTKSLYAGLESKYTTLYEDIKRFAEASDIEVINFRIYELVSEYRSEDLIAYASKSAKERKRRFQILREKYFELSIRDLLKVKLSDEERLILYDAFTAIGTKLKLTEEEQWTIMLAGFNIVHIQRHKLDHLIANYLQDEWSSDTLVTKKQ